MHTLNSDKSSQRTRHRFPVGIYIHCPLKRCKFMLPQHSINQSSLTLELRILLPVKLLSPAPNDAIYKSIYIYEVKVSAKQPQVFAELSSLRSLSRVSLCKSFTIGLLNRTSAQQLKLSCGICIYKLNEGGLLQHIVRIKRISQIHA